MVEVHHRQAHYTHEEKEGIFKQFRLLPEPMQTAFVAGITKNPEIGANPNLIAAGMQGLINQHVAGQSANPFAAMLANTQLSPDLLAMNVPKAAHAVSLTVPGQQRGRSDGWEMT